MTDIDLGVHRPGPTPEEPPYFRRCLRCDLSWPCPARLAEVRAANEEITAARISDDARRVGVLALVEKGVSVWSSTRVDAYGAPLGGVVVEIEDVTSPETGEIERWFTCLDPVGGVPVTARRIAEAEIRPAGVEGTVGSRLTNLVRRLAQEIATAKGSYLDPHQAQRVRWMYVLTGVSNLAA
jgi:hypothetical protein